MKIEGHAGIQFWLNRISQEYVAQASELIDKAQTMNWQAINFKTMRPQEQTKVFEQIRVAMKELGWEDEWNRYKDEVNP